jgi:hypothetical protein
MGARNAHVVSFVAFVFKGSFLPRVGHPLCGGDSWVVPRKALQAVRRYFGMLVVEQPGHRWNSAPSPRRQGPLPSGLRRRVVRALRAVGAPVRGAGRGARGRGGVGGRAMKYVPWGGVGVGVALVG